MNSLFGFPQRQSARPESVENLIAILRLVQDMRRAQRMSDSQEARALEGIVDREIETLAGSLT